MARLLTIAALLAGAHGLVGTKVPDVDIDFGFPPTKINLPSYVAGKKMILVGLPGAFTPTWSTRQIPGYLEEAETLKALGVDEVMVYCVNDGAVMDAWAKDQGCDQEAGLVKLFGDPSGALTRALGLSLEDPGPMAKLGYPRTKRSALYIEDGTIKIFKVSERGPNGEDDPAGDDYPEETLAPSMIAALKELNLKSEL